MVTTQPCTCRICSKAGRAVISLALSFTATATPGSCPCMSGTQRAQQAAHYCVDRIPNTRRKVYWEGRPCSRSSQVLNQAGGPAPTARARLWRGRRPSPRTPPDIGWPADCAAAHGDCADPSTSSKRCTSGTAACVSRPFSWKAEPVPFCRGLPLLHPVHRQMTLGAVVSTAQRLAIHGHEGRVRGRVHRRSPALQYRLHDAGARRRPGGRGRGEPSGPGCHGAGPETCAAQPAGSVHNALRPSSAPQAQSARIKMSRRLCLRPWARGAPHPVHTAAPGICVGDVGSVNGSAAPGQRSRPGQVEHTLAWLRPCLCPPPV